MRVSDTSARIQARDTEIDAGEHPGREPKRCGLGVAGGTATCFGRSVTTKLSRVAGMSFAMPHSIAGTVAAAPGRWEVPTAAYEERKREVVANPNARVSEFRH